MYQCKGCGEITDGLFWGKGYPTCNNCDSDILEKIELSSFEMDIVNQLSLPLLNLIVFEYHINGKKSTIKLFIKTYKCGLISAKNIVEYLVEKYPYGFV